MKKEEIREKFYEETGLDYWDAGWYRYGLL